jgi:hypothetical protein
MENTTDIPRALSASDLFVPIVPVPLWEEEPEKITDGDMAGVWAGRYQKLVMTRSGYPDVDVDVDFAIPPSEDAKPVSIEGVWHWTNAIGEARADSATSPRDQTT